ncbi:sugar O-acetyltransferase [Arthrobacter koreensis]|uniref:sugar O-acetyltransferase n=1 Tax=Arthrobacter koreensis TaxID=199136 RepID=UPI003D917ADF
MAKYFENDSRSMRDRMQAGDLYIADDPQLEADSLRAASLSDQYNRLSPQDPDAAAPLLAELLGGIGEQSVIRAPLFVDYGKYLTVGARTFINFNLTALDVAAITIGDDVQIGPNVQLLTPTHPLEAEARRDKLEAAKPITIGNDVWLGGGVIVLPGVNIGENTVVGAGSVVTRDLPANVVAVGNPARVIRELPES